MEVHVDKFVKEYVSQMAGKSVDIERFVPEASGLSPEGMLAALGHPDIGRLGIQLMADFMAPTGSLYFDAIYGAFHGQREIRAWLVPTMAEIEFIDFVPTAEPVFLMMETAFRRWTNGRCSPTWAMTRFRCREASACVDIAMDGSRGRAMCMTLVRFGFRRLQIQDLKRLPCPRIRLLNGQ